MDKKKIEFINALLSSPKLDANMKQKFFQLAAKELEVTNASHADISQRLTVLEQRLETLGKTEAFEKPVKETAVALPHYTNPSSLSKYLIAFNQDPILKYTCHNIDDDSVISNINSLCGTNKYNFIKHQNLIEDRYREFQEQHFANPKIKNLILVYLTGRSFTGLNTAWSTENININWKSPELFAWSEKNECFVPNPGENLIYRTHNKGFKLPKTFKSNLAGERINYFSQLVIHFKNLFHLRGDNSLQSLIEAVNKSEKWEDKIVFEIAPEELWPNLELFTDVDKLIQAYRIIVRQILTIKERFNQTTPIVKVAFKEIEQGVIFTVHHRNSVYKKTLSNTIERIGDDHKNLIVNQINGLCDFYVRANFDNKQFAIVNLWDGKFRRAQTIDYFEGGEFILKFPK